MSRLASLIFKYTWYMGSHHLSDRGWVDFDPSCAILLPYLPNSYLPKQESDRQIKFNPTQVWEGTGRPVLIMHHSELHRLLRSFGRTELLAWRTCSCYCDHLWPVSTKCDQVKLVLRGAPPCHQQNRHYCHDCHCFASSHCWGAVAEVLAGTPAVGEAVVGVVTSEKEGDFFEWTCGGANCKLIISVQESNLYRNDKIS